MSLRAKRSNLPSRGWRGSPNAMNRIWEAQIAASSHRVPRPNLLATSQVLELPRSDLPRSRRNAGRSLALWGLQHDFSCAGCTRTGWDRAIAPTMLEAQSGRLPPRSGGIFRPRKTAKIPLPGGSQERGTWPTCLSVLPSCMETRSSCAWAWHPDGSDRSFPPEGGTPNRSNPRSR